MALVNKELLQKQLEAYDLIIENIIYIYGVSIKHNPEMMKENLEAAVESIKDILKERDKTIKVFSK